MIRSAKKLLAIFLIIITAIVLCSCGASHNIAEETIYKDKDFTYNKLKKNEVAIAGIASQKLTFTNKERNQYSTLLSTVLMEELKDVHSINLINNTELMRSLGEKNYITLMLEYDVEQKLVDSAMIFIKEWVPEADFIIIANIENENIIDRSSERQVHYENKDDETTTNYKKTYYITVEFQVYDLNQEKLISSILMYNRAVKTESRTTKSGCFESCLTSIFQAIAFGSPAEIDRTEVLAEIFKKYAEKLALQ